MARWQGANLAADGCRHRAASGARQSTRAIWWRCLAACAPAGSQPRRPQSETLSRCLDGQLWRPKGANGCAGMLV